MLIVHFWICWYIWNEAPQFWVQAVVTAVTLGVKGWNIIPFGIKCIVCLMIHFQGMKHALDFMLFVKHTLNTLDIPPTPQRPKVQQRENSQPNSDHFLIQVLIATNSDVTIRAKIGHWIVHYWFKDYILHHYIHLHFTFLSRCDNVQFMFVEKEGEQECIPVGCVPPACCPYLPACTAPGGCTWSRRSTWSQRGCTWSQWGTCPGTPPPVNRILDTRFWKYYLAPNFVCGR